MFKLLHDSSLYQCWLPRIQVGINPRASNVRPKTCYRELGVLSKTDVGEPGFRRPTVNPKMHECHNKN